MPNRPVGLTIKTSTMNRYISPSVNSGKPRLPNERIRPMASAATKCADDRTHAADHRNDEQLDENRESHSRRQRANRRGKRAGETGKQAAERKDQSVKIAGVDAERGHHARIVSRGADRLAKAHAVDDQPKGQSDYECDADHEQVKWRHDAAGNEERWHLKRRRHSHRLEFGAPGDFDQVVEDKDEAVTDEELHQYISTVDPADE